MMNAQENEAPYGDGEAPWIVVENGDISYTRRRPARSRAFTEIYEPWVGTEYPVSTLPPTTHGSGHNPSDSIEFIDPPLVTEICTRSGPVCLPKRSRHQRVPLRCRAESRRAVPVLLLTTR
eukprot:7383327-Prymnesium_polylepis.1